MNQLARVGFVLLGVDVLLTSLNAVPGLLAAAFVGSVWAFGMLAGWAILGLAPALAVALKSQALADALVGPAQPGLPEFNTRTLLTAGLAISGIWFVLSGLATGLAASATLLFSFDVDGALAMRSTEIVRGILHLGAGAMLALRSRQIADFLSRESEKPAV